MKILYESDGLYFIECQWQPSKARVFFFYYKKVKFVFSHVLFYEILNMCAIL